MPRRNVGFAVKVVGEPGLPSHDTRRWQSKPHLRESLERLRGILDYLARVEIGMCIACVRHIAQIGYRLSRIAQRSRALASSHHAAEGCLARPGRFGTAPALATISSSQGRQQRTSAAR
jgi:hypothetical protein